MAALGTAAAALGQVLVKVVFAIVVRQLLAGFNATHGHDKYLVAWAVGLAVGAAGVVDITCFVGGHVAVYGVAALNFKKIFAPARGLLLFGTHSAPGVAYNAGAFGYLIKRKDAAACLRAAHGKFKVARGVF